MTQKHSETAAELSRLRARQAVLEASVTRYRALFEESPVALWEEDFSGVKNRMDALRAKNRAS